MFWIIIAVLIFIALAFLVPTLLSQNHVQRDGRREQNISIANEQLEDLETRFEQGEIETEDYQSSREEIERSLFSDINGLDTENTASTDKSSLFSAVFILVLIPTIAILGYLKVGELVFVDSVDSKMAVEKSIPRNADGTPDIDTMIAGLQKKMENDPKNAKGWLMLGRSYMVLKRYPEAAKSYERALKLRPNSADLMLSLADSYAMMNNGSITGRSIELINKALTIEPNNLTALWLGGMVARQQGENTVAIKRWKKLLPFVNSPSERKEVESLITEAARLLSPEELASISVLEKVETVSSEGAASSAEITVTVSLSEEMKEKASQSDIVFVYAKAMSGPPMPLAAAKVQVKDLPLEITLNDSMAMMPSMKLSSFSTVIVGARVSKSGQPISQNGDLYVEKSSISHGDKVSLEINQILIK